MTESTTPTDTDTDSSDRTDYDAIINALGAPLIVQFNTSDPTSMTTEEFHVEHTNDDGSVDLRSGETWYRLRERKPHERGSEAYAIFEDQRGEFIDHYVDVTTIEVVGVGK